MNPIVSTYISESELLMQQASWLLRRASSASPDWHSRADEVVRKMDALTLFDQPAGPFPLESRS